MNTQVERSYLEIKSINELVAINKPFNDLYLNKINPPDFQLNKFFYKEIGKKHKWVDRLEWSDRNWSDYLNSSNVKTYVLKQTMTPALLCPDVTNTTLQLGVIK